MPHEMMLLIFVILAGMYMAWNIGANDVANAMGTSVGSGALTLKQAVIVAAILEFSGAFFFGSHVSETIQKGIIDPQLFYRDPMILAYGMLSVLLAAGVWLQIASYNGWPVSTTHSIVGSLVGFGMVIGGVEAVYWENVVFIGTSWILSPLCGGIVSYSIFNLLRRKIFYASDPVKAAKKMTPPLVFFVFSALSLIMMYNGLQNVHLHLNFWQAASLSLAIGAIGFLVSYFAVQRISLPPSIAQKPVDYQPEVSNQLAKARKHLLNVKESSLGAVQYQVSELLEEVDLLSSSLKKREEETNRESVEYAIVERIFGYLQIISACLMAFSHGANDVANAIGPLSAAIAILTTGSVVFQTAVPTWALGLGGLGIVIGLATWGWRVIETIGKKITELTPTRGFAAEFGAALTILLATRLGMPISTTHTLVGSVIGVGMARGIEALDMRTTRHIVISWMVTVPAGAVITMGFFFLIKLIFG